jgi:hypothetical protein
MKAVLKYNFQFPALETLIFLKWSFTLWFKVIKNFFGSFRENLRGAFSLVILNELIVGYLFN